MRCIYSQKELGVRLINLNCVLSTYIEPEIEEDDYKFNLQKNKKLLKKFVMYRLCKLLVEVLKTTKTYKLKNLFYLDTDLQLCFLNEIGKDVVVLIKQLNTALCLNLYISNRPFNTALDLLNSKKGEGTEQRAIIKNIVTKNNRMPNIEKFKKLLKKYDIHKLEGDIADNYNIKLGLFVT